MQSFDFQFYPARALQLQEKELLWAKKEVEYQVPLREAKTEDEPAETIEAERKAEQDAIDNGMSALFSDTNSDPFQADEFTEDDAKELEDLLQLGFASWTRREFQQFVKALEKYGRFVF